MANGNYLMEHPLCHEEADGIAASKTVVVVGGGLAGLSAALSARERGARVILVEKESTLGGNSAKASSGMNATSPSSGDSDDAFFADTMASGGGLSDHALVAALTSHSEDALARLEAAGLDLSVVTQLGGHSFPRTHVNSKGPNVGRYIVSQLAKAAEAAGVEVRLNTRLREVLRDEDGVEGVLVGSDGAESADAACIWASAVVIATGGFGASQEMLRQFAPHAAGLPTSNGLQATGDGLLAAISAGGVAVHMDQVQVHPTGFVNPSDPSSPTKFLAPERLRGVGAILLSPTGERFVDELSTRDRVTEAIQAAGSGHFPEVRLVLPAAGREAYGAGTIDFYTSKGFFEKVAGVGGLAAALGVPEEHVRETVSAYNRAARGEEADAFGKKVFPAIVDEEGDLWVARVTPVVHYCMGGVRFDPRGRMLDGDGRPIPGVFAAGEVTGGLHGKNRLGGNSLLECAVMGTSAGRSAAEHALGGAAGREGGEAAEAAGAEVRHEEL